MIRAKNIKLLVFSVANMGMKTRVLRVHMTLLAQSRGIIMIRAKNIKLLVSSVANMF